MPVRVIYQSIDSNPLGQVRVVAEVTSGRGVETTSYRRFDGFGLTLITEGAGVYERPGKEPLAIETGQILVTLPVRPHRFGPRPGQTWHEVFVVFDGEMFELLASRGVLHDDPPVQTWGHPDLRAELLALGDSSLRTETRTARLFELILGHGRATFPGTAADPAWLAAASRYLQESPRESRTGHDAAIQIGMGYESFRKRFALATGLSPDRFRLQHRLRLANTLLQRTDLSVKEVAAEVGFADPLYFSRRFRDEFSRWPTEVRGASIDPRVLPRDSDDQA